MPNTSFQITKETEPELLIKLQDLLEKNGQTLKIQHLATTILVRTLVFMGIQNTTKLYQTLRVLIEQIKLNFFDLLIMYVIFNIYHI